MWTSWVFSSACRLQMWMMTPNVKDLFGPSSASLEEVYSEVSGVTLDIMDPVSQFTDPVTGLTHYTFAGHLECASLPVPNGAVTDFSSVSWEGVQPICTVNWATDWDWKFLHVVLDEDVKDKRIVLDIQLALCHSDTEKYLNRRVRKYLHSGKDSICTLPSSAELKQVVVRPGRLAKLAPRDSAHTGCGHPAAAHQNSESSRL